MKLENQYELRYAIIEFLKRKLQEEMNIDFEPYVYFGENHWYGEMHNSANCLSGDVCEL
jgi:hypothetical protein